MNYGLSHVPRRVAKRPSDVFVNCISEMCVLCRHVRFWSTLFLTRMSLIFILKPTGNPGVKDYSAGALFPQYPETLLVRCLHTGLGNPALNLALDISHLCLNAAFTATTEDCFGRCLLSDASRNRREEEGQQFQESCVMAT